METRSLTSTPRSVFKNTLALFIAKLAVMVGSIVLVFFLSRLLKAEGLGSYATAMALFGLGELACDFGLTNFIPRELAKDLGQTNRYFVHGSLLVLVIGFFATFALVIAGSVLGYSSDTVMSIYLIAPALMASALHVILSATFVTYHKVEYDTAATLFWIALRIPVSVFLLIQGYGVFGVIIAFAVSNYLSTFTAFFFYVRYIDKPHWEFDWAFARHLLLSLRTFMLLAIAGSVFTQAETIILSILRDDTQVGLYSAAYKLVTVWYLIPASFMGIVFPVLSQAYQQSPQRSREIQDRSTKYLLFIALPLAVGGFVVAEPVIHLFYGPSFEPAVDVFRLLSWQVLTVFINNVFWRILLANNQQHLALRVQVISGLVKVGLSFWLAGWLGAIGAAWAATGGFMVYTLLHMYYIWRSGIRIPFLQLGGRFAGAALLMGVVLFFLMPYLHLFVIIALGVVLYSVLVLVLRGFSQEDLNLFRRIRYARIKEQDYAPSNG